MERVTEHIMTDRTSPLQVEQLPLHLQPARFEHEREMHVRGTSRTGIKRDAWKDYLVQSEGDEV